MTSSAALSTLTGSASPAPVGAVSQALLSTAANAPALQALTQAATGSAAATPTSSSLSQSPTPALSPNFKVDPAAGVIVQILNDKGQVQSQTPSATVVAYLKAGLTAQGLLRSSNTVA